MSTKIKMFGQSGRSVEEVFGDFVLAQTASNTVLPVFLSQRSLPWLFVTVARQKNRISPGFLQASRVFSFLKKMI